MNKDARRKLLTLDILTASAQVLRSSSFVYETDPTGKPFDSFAREATLTASSSLGSSRSEAFTDNDNFILWVLGQRATHSVNAIEADRTDYDAKAMPWKFYSFALIQKTLTYETA